jgi:hypothetical protein
MQEELLGCLEDHAALAAQEGDPTRAVRLLAAATVSRARLGLAAAPRVERRHQDLQGHPAPGAARRRLCSGVERRTGR